MGNSKNNGGDTDYYKLKPEWKTHQDVIEDREMNCECGKKGGFRLYGKWWCDECIGKVI